MKKVLKLEACQRPTVQVKAEVQPSHPSWLQEEVAQVNLPSEPMGQRHHLQEDKECMKWSHARDPEKKPTCQ